MVKSLKLLEFRNSPFFSIFPGLFKKYTEPSIPCLYALAICLITMSTSRVFALDNDQIQTVHVVNEVVKVYGLTYVFYPFEVPSDAFNIRLVGAYDVVGGTEPSIELRIIDRERCAFPTESMSGCAKYFEKVVKSFGVVDLILPPGKKYLLEFDNRQSDIIDFKQIIAKFDLSYELGKSYDLLNSSQYLGVKLSYDCWN